jgi:release factor glutamine methyltransferase
MTTRSAVSVRDALDGAVTAITAGGSPSARLDAELLLADALGVSRARLLIEPEMGVAGPAVRRVQSHEREPVAYIVGSRAFRRIVLSVDARVLVPRPETELLVEVASELDRGARVLDCCTGSGAIALALKDERDDLDVTGSDISEQALAVAKANGARLGLAVSWRRADLLEGLGDSFAAVIANPPYVPSAVLATLEPEITRHEPPIALDGGSDGLLLIGRLIAQVTRTSASTLAIEHGEGQADAVAQRCRESGFTSIERRRDLAGIERMLLARR